jgi:gas vesicle protein
MARENSGGGSVLAAFLFGALAGAAVALLLAPTSGEEMRRKLAERAREGREKANDAAREGREFVNRQREHLASAVERGREAYHRARETMVETGEPKVEKV